MEYFNSRWLLDCWLSGCSYFSCMQSSRLLFGRLLPNCSVLSSDFCKCWLLRCSLPDCCALLRGLIVALCFPFVTLTEAVALSPSVLVIVRCRSHQLLLLN